MRPEFTEKVLEKLATSDKATIVVERASEGKNRVTSGSWDNEKVILRDEVLEVRNVDGRLHIKINPQGAAASSDIPRNPPRADVSEIRAKELDT